MEWKNKMTCKKHNFILIHNESDKFEFTKQNVEKYLKEGIYCENIREKSNYVYLDLTRFPQKSSKQCLSISLPNNLSKEDIIEELKIIIVEA